MENRVAESWNFYLQELRSSEGENNVPDSGENSLPEWLLALTLLRTEC